MKKLFYLLALILVVLSGCKKNLDINQNPNAATDENITPNLLLATVEVRTAARMANQYDWTGRWMGYWARSGTYGPQSEEEAYQITTSFEAGQWSGWYDILFDNNTMEAKAEASGETFYNGAAKILKTIGFMYLVDMYNNVPYSTAFDLANNITPAYQSGEAIYDSLFLALDEGIALMQASENVENTFDVLFHGDTQRWIQFANTQRLKLLLRKSETGFDPSSEIAKIDANGAGYIGSGQTAYVDPGYSQTVNTDNISQQNPYWDIFKESYIGEVADQYNRANNYVLDLYRNNDDIRYQYVFSEAASPLSGNDNDLYYGFNYGEVIPNDDPYKAANSSDVAGPGLVSGPSDPQWLLSSVEALFLQAEAIQRGWIDGDAQQAYEEAVTESFVYLGVAGAETEAATYLSQTGTVMSWTAATTPDAKINLILTQKYLALCGTNNFEPWVDWRRRGVPAVPQSLAPSVGSNHIPLRLRYPQSEYNYNADNVGAEGNPDPQTSGIFWDN